MAAAPTMPPQAQAAAAAAAAADTRHSAGVITSAGSPPAANAPLHAQVAMISSPPLAADRDIAISSPPLAADRDMAAAAANTRPSPQTASARADDATSPASPHGSAPATPEALTERACAENATAAARAGALHSTGGSQDVPSAPACSPSLSPTVPRTGCQAARSAAAASPTQSPCLPCAGHQAACPSGSLSWGDPQCVGAAGAGASHMEERPGIPTPPLHARPLLEQPTQQHMEQAPQQREGIEPKALPMNAEARTAAPPTAAAGPQPSGKGTPANNRSPSSSTLAVGPSPHPVESHVSLLPSPPPKASPSSGKPPPTALPAPPPAPVAPTPAQPPPNLAPAQQQAVSSLAQLLAMPEEAQWQWLQSCFPVSFNEGLVVQPVPGSHPTHHKHLIHPALELLGEALFQATRRRSYEAHEVSTYIVGKQIELQFGRVETLNTLEEHMSGLAWGAHIERLKAHLKGGGTVLSFLEALATKGCKEDPAWSGYYIKDLDLYSELAHLPAARQTVQSLLSSVCPDDLLRFHFPLLGVTPTRPILYLAGYLGGVGRHVEDDGMQFINLSLPIPSIEAQGLPNAVEWYMDDSDDTQQLAKHAAKRAPKDQATKLHFCNHAKRNLDQRHAREQPTITQAPVCSDSQAQQGTGSYADLVMGNLGHAVIVAGGWCRISSNCATPSHMLKVHAPNGYKQALVEEQRQAFFRIQQGKWERKLGSPLLLTNCILSALSAPKDHLRFSPSETESFVALVLLLLLQACKDRHQLAALIQASSGEQRPASPPSHTHVAGAAAARAAAARAAAPAAPDVPKVAVVHAGAPHLTVAAGIVGTAQAGAALAGHSDASAAGNACARDLFANPDWIDAFSCRKHRQDQALCGAAAGCVGCALQRLLMQQAQQTQQQKQQQGQEQGEGEEELGQLGQQQEAAGAQDEGSMAERHPWRCKLQEQDLKDQGQEQEPERAQDNASMEEQVDRMQVEHGQRQEEHSTAQTSSGLHCTARKRGQQQPQQQGPAQPTKRTRTQRHGQAQPHKQGTSLRSMQFSKGQLGLAACWQRRLVCLRPLQEDPTAQVRCWHVCVNVCVCVRELLLNLEWNGHECMDMCR
uniref:Uncharacterized protein n=1 Tax=Dunaliella tertiolecta TaxID=3047 RepID=A0A7S3QY60_DUNTE